VTDRTESYGYDAADQLIAATLKAGDATERRINYEYDAAGNRTKEEAVVGTLPQTTDYEALEFDAVNRATAVVKGMRRSEFFYDEMGGILPYIEQKMRVVWVGIDVKPEKNCTEYA
jgi:uncharacterized protein RhaS with RHS repeats